MATAWIFSMISIARASTEIVLITGHASVETAVEALRLGAADYLTKPINFRRLKALLSRVPRTVDLKAEIGALRGELRRLGHFGQMLGAAPVDAKILRPYRPRRADRSDGAAAGRKRHRQGAGGANHS